VKKWFEPERNFAFFAGALAEYIVARLLGAAAWAAEHKWRARALTCAFVVALGSQLSVAQGIAGYGSFGADGVDITAAPPDTTPPPPSAAPTTVADALSTTDALKRIADSVNVAMKALSDNSRLKFLGQILPAFFLIALLTFGAIKTLARGGGMSEMIGEWVPVFISFGVVYFFVQRGVGDQIVSFLGDVSEALGAPRDMSSALTRGVDPMFKAMVAAFQMPLASDTTGFSLQALVMKVPMFIAKALVALLILVAAVIMAAHVIMSQISVQLVLALAPLMVPFLMFRPASFIFDGWLKFLITSSLLKLVAGFTLLMVGGMLGGLTKAATDMAAQMQNAPSADKIMVDLVTLGMMVVFALLSALVMHQAPNLAHGLMSGSGAHGFGGMGPVTGGRGMGVANAGTSRTLKFGRDSSGGILKGTLDSVRGKGADGAKRSLVGRQSYAAGQKAGPYVVRGANAVKNAGSAAAQAAVPLAKRALDRINRTGVT